MFTGFPEETLQFFLDIRYHNDKAYFAEHKPRYERDVKAVFHAFIEELAPTMQGIDPMMEIRPYKCLARIHRDTRFTKDKSPFRDHLWLCFRHGAEPREGSVNFFFELGPSNLGWGFGTWGENRPMMEVFRRRLAAEPEKYARIIDGCHLERNDMTVWNQTWKRMEVPPGLPLGLKGWYTSKDVYVGRAHPDWDAIGTHEIADVVRKDFQTLAPLYSMLRGCYEEAADGQGM